MGTNTNLYERDFFQWTQTTAALIRQGKWSQIDPHALAEELESLGKRDLRELEDRLETLLYNLLTWWAQTEERCGRWANDISQQRYAMALSLRDSPSLHKRLNSTLADAYPSARQKALHHTELVTLPETCPFTMAQVLDEDFWPQDLTLIKPDNPA